MHLLPGVQSKVIMVIPSPRKGLFREWLCDINIVNVTQKEVVRGFWQFLLFLRQQDLRKTIPFCLCFFFVESDDQNCCCHHVLSLYMSQTLWISERRGKGSKRNLMSFLSSQINRLGEYPISGLNDTQDSVFPNSKLELELFYLWPKHCSPITKVEFGP